jgi:hypothetical protein
MARMIVRPVVNTSRCGSRGSLGISEFLLKKVESQNHHLITFGAVKWSNVPEPQKGSRPPDANA